MEEISLSKNDEEKVRASPIKIAYYVQNLSKNESDIRKIIFAIRSQFDSKDIREFARKYRHCLNDDSVRRVADMMSSIPTKRMEKVMNQLLEAAVYRTE